jgi:hypothetical protein
LNGVVLVSSPASAVTVTVKSPTGVVSCVAIVNVDVQGSEHEPVENFAVALGGRPAMRRNLVFCDAEDMSVAVIVFCTACP